MLSLSPFKLTKVANSLYIKFNPKKSECICFSGDRKQVKYDVYLNNKKIKWVTHVQHLGNTLMSDLDESREIRRKMGDRIEK